MSFRISFTRAAKTADMLIGHALHKLIEAGEVAEQAAKHALEALAHHEEEILFHRTAHANALSLHNEAQQALSDIKAALGSGAGAVEQAVAKDVVPVVEKDAAPVAEAAVAAAVEDVAKSV